MILSKKGITKALIRLHGCAGWSAPLLFAITWRQGFSRRGPYSPNNHEKYGKLSAWSLILQGWFFSLCILKIQTSWAFRSCYKHRCVQMSISITVCLYPTIKVYELLPDCADILTPLEVLFCYLGRSTWDFLKANAPPPPIKRPCWR